MVLSASIDLGGEMENIKINVIIPAYKPGEEFANLIKRLWEQECRPNRILVMNTEEGFWNPRWEKQCPVLEVHHLKKEEFDHGGTRKRAAALSDADILVFMTQDALPADRKLVGSLIKPLLEDERVGAAYARQLPGKDCSFLERYTRSFNYPETSSVKFAEDLPVYGIKTFFCSNVCAAYDKKTYDELGGFVERAIFNEDMIYAGNLIKNGRGVAYAAEARVIHSHNYSCAQQFHRNFDLGVSQAEHPEIFREVSSEGEGLRLIKKTMAHVCRAGRPWLVFSLAAQSGCKYAGYFLGKRFQKLPHWLILRCTMSKSYWNEKR